MVSILNQKLIQQIKTKHKIANQRSAMTLHAIQGALLAVLLALILILVFTADDSRHRLYIPLIFSLFCILFCSISEFKR